MKVVINRCFGGFGLSNEAKIMYLTLKEIPYVVKDEDEYGHTQTHVFTDNGERKYFGYEIERDDKDLVTVIESLGDMANDGYSRLKVVNLPNDVKSWYIHDYDGMETIHETHRSWT